MVSAYMMKVLAIVYLVIMIMSLFEGNLGRAVYWLGAFIITCGVLMGT